MSKKGSTIPVSYEAALRELQDIVNQLQEESVAMDQLVTKVERAGELIQFCREKLRKVETALNEKLSTNDFQS